MVHGRSRNVRKIFPLRHSCTHSYVVVTACDTSHKTFVKRQGLSPFHMEYRMAPFEEHEKKAPPSLDFNEARMVGGEPDLDFIVRQLGVRLQNLSQCDNVLRIFQRLIVAERTLTLELFWFKFALDSCF